MSDLDHSLRAALPDVEPGESRLRGAWSHWIAASVLLAGALIYWPRLPLDAYDAPKLGLVAMLLACAPWSRPRLGWRLGSVLLAIIVSVSLSAIAAPDPAVFWFGTPQRGQGGFALLLCLLLCCWSIGTRAGGLQRLARAGQLAVLLVCVLAALQWFGLDPLRSAAARPTAGMGNAVHLGQWLVLILPLCVWQARRDVAPLWSWLLVLLGALALLASGTRGALLGGLFAWTLLWAWPRYRWRTAAALAVALSCVVLLALLPWRSASVEHRLQLWGDALTVLQTPPEWLWPSGAVDTLQHLRPWVGYGADLQVMPMRVVAKTHAVFSADPDRAHNLLLDLLLRYGIVGMLAWLWAAGWIGHALLTARTQLSASAQPALLGGLLAWVLSLQSGFVGTADSLAAALLLGAALARSSEVARVPGPRSAVLLLRGFLIVAGLFIWLLPPRLLPPAWRAPEQALLIFDEARRQLNEARVAASPEPACALGELALRSMLQAHQADPGRPEYLRSVATIRQALCQNCFSSSENCDAAPAQPAEQLNVAPSTATPPASGV